jgi:hypothetical protein
MRNEPSSDPNQPPSPIRSPFRDLCDLLAQLLATKYIDLSKNASQSKEPDEEQPS